MWIVAIGNAFDGLTLVGPFESCDIAVMYAEDGGSPWEVIQLEAPNEEWMKEFNTGV